MLPSCQRRLLPVLAFFSSAVAAADLRQAEAVPQLGPRGVESYREFLASGTHRAFVIAPGGSWAWRADLASAEQAEEAALDDCRAQTAQPCVPYAIDDQVAFDARRWPRLWRPYSTAESARDTVVGTRRGQRFPDLVLRDAAGKSQKISGFRGQVVLLHFWGSWCGPCRRELPDLQRLVGQLEKERAVRFVFVAMREPFAAARDWATRQGLKLPLYDAGGTEQVSLADGSRLSDRQIAGKFPTTYVLDRHGVVLFSHVGDASRWTEYAPFLKDAATFSGRRD